MPIITIKEQDNTRGGGTNEITDVVFLPGFGSHSFTVKDEDDNDLEFDDVDAWYGEIITDKAKKAEITKSMLTNRAKPGEIKYCTTISEFETYFGASYPKYAEDQPTEMEILKDGSLVKYNFSENALSGMTDSATGKTYLYKANDIDRSYIMAKEYLNAGLPIYYVMLNGFTEDKDGYAIDLEAPEAKNVYEYLVENVASELSDKNEYSVKYITTGGYPTAEFGNCPDTPNSDVNKYELNPIECEVKITLGNSTDTVGEVKTIGAINLGEYESQKVNVLANYNSDFKNSGLYELGGACQYVDIENNRKWYIDITNPSNNKVNVKFDCNHPAFDELRDTKSKIGIYVGDTTIANVEVPNNLTTKLTGDGNVTTLPDGWETKSTTNDGGTDVVITIDGDVLTNNVDKEISVSGTYTVVGSETGLSYSVITIDKEDENSYTVTFKSATQSNELATVATFEATIEKSDVETAEIDITNLFSVEGADNTLVVTSAIFSTSSSVASTLASLAEKRGDAIAFIDEFNNPKRPLNTNEGASFYSSFTSGDFIIKNTFATVIAGNHRVNCPFAGMEVTVPGSYCYLTSLAQSIKVNGNWLAVAGVTRGVVPNYIANASNYRLSNVIADAYTTETGVSINPITNIKPYGYTIWGNRTLKNNGADGLTATSFLNLRNLMCDVKKRIFVAAKMCMFEQNNDILWINFKSLITPTLDKLLTGYGISNYKIEKVATAKKGKLQAVVRLYPIYAVEEFEVLVTFEDEDVTVE
jgi:hypothetical protein